METTDGEREFLEKFCQDILRSDNSIRFVGVADNLGHLVATQYRKGLAPLMDKKDTEKYTVQAIIRAGSRKEFESKIGRQRYAVGVYENLVRATVPVAISRNRNLYLLLSFDLDSDFVPIINRKVLPMTEKIKEHFI